MNAFSAVGEMIISHLEFAFRDVAEDKLHQSGAHHFAESGRGEGKEIPSVTV